MLRCYIGCGDDYTDGCMLEFPYVAPVEASSMLRSSDQSPMGRGWIAP